MYWTCGSTAQCGSTAKEKPTWSGMQMTSYVGFQYEEDARRFYTALQNRLKRFNLEIAEEKSQIIAFGRQAEAKSRAGGKKPRPLIS